VIVVATAEYRYFVITFAKHKLVTVTVYRHTPPPRARFERDIQ